MPLQVTLVMQSNESMTKQSISATRSGLLSQTGIQISGHHSLGAGLITVFLAIVPIIDMIHQIVKTKFKIIGIFYCGNL